MLFMSVLCFVLLIGVGTFTLVLMDTSMFSDSICPICLRDIDCDKSFALTAKGLETLAGCASVYGHLAMKTYLLSCQSTVRVHEGCRKKYTNSRELDKFSKGVNDVGNSVPAKKLRSATQSFDFKLHCLYCGGFVDFRNVGRDMCLSVRTLELQSSVLHSCEKRGHDAWAMKVSSRVQSCNDLVAEEPVYHKTCHDRFHLGKPMAGEADCPLLKAPHRPLDMTKQASFSTLCEWLESQTDRYLYSVTELRGQLLTFGYSEDAVYSVKYLKIKLQQHYGDHVVFVEHEGQQDVVCLQRMASFVLREQWKKQKMLEDDETESQRIVAMAAKLVRALLREMQYTRETYPTETDISDLEGSHHFIPNLLHTFLQVLVSNQVKEVAIGNAIVQAARPRSVVTPILFGVGVQMDHMYGSKWLVDQLARLGFSVSSAEVYRFKSSVLQAEQMMGAVPEMLAGSFIQWVGDNVDHNVASLDGRGSFHGMGIIAVSNQAGVNGAGANPVKRLERMTANANVQSFGFPIHEYVSSGGSTLSSITVKELRCVQQPVRFSDVKRYPINNISVAQINIRNSNGHSAYRK